MKCLKGLSQACHHPHYPLSFWGARTQVSWFTPVSPRSPHTHKMSRRCSIRDARALRSGPQADSVKSGFSRATAVLSRWQVSTLAKLTSSAAHGFQEGWSAQMGFIPATQPLGVRLWWNAQTFRTGTSRDTLIQSTYKWIHVCLLTSRWCLSNLPTAGRGAPRGAETEGGGMQEWNEH